MDLIRKLWDSQRKHEAHIDAALKALGYARHGASLRITAALGHYGLTEESGSKDNRKIRVSELAQDILHHLDSDPKRKQALKKAALMPAIHAALWERYGMHLPDDNAIRPFLIRDKGFNEDIVQNVIENYRSSFDFAKLDSSEVDTPEATKEETKLHAANPPDSVKEASVACAPQVAFKPEELPILVGGGKIARIPFPMSEDDFDLLIGTLNLWKKRIVKSE